MISLVKGLLALSVWSLFISCSHTGVDNFSATGTLVVLNKHSDTAMLFDLSTSALIAELPTGKEPHEAVVSIDGKIAICSNYSDGSLTIIDIPNHRINKTISLGENYKPHGLAILTEPNKVLVTSESTKSLLIVNIESGLIESIIKTNQDISHMVMFDENRNFAFVSNIASGSINVIDLEIKKSIKIIETGNGAEGMDFSNDRNQLWVGNRGANSISVIDLKKLEVIETLETSDIPIRIKASMDSSYMFVNYAGSREFKAIDISSRKLFKSIRFKAGFFKELTSHSKIPIGLLNHPDGNYAFVATSNGNTIEVIDLNNWKVVKSISASGHPDGMAYSSHNY